MLIATIHTEADFTKSPRELNDNLISSGSNVNISRVTTNNYFL